jgi:hypothetical protein
LVGPQEARLKEIPMFCQHCGTPVPDGASTCPRCSAAPGPTGSVAAAATGALRDTTRSAAAGVVKGAAGDALAALQTCARDPVGGLPHAYAELGEARALRAGVAFGVLSLACFLAGGYLFLPPFLRADLFEFLGFGGVMKCLLFGAVPFTCTAAGSAAVRKALGGQTGAGGLGGDAFTAGAALVPVSLAMLLAGMLGLANAEVVGLLAVFAGCTAILVLFSGYTRITKLSERAGTLAVPLVVVFAAWLAKVIAASVLSPSGGPADMPFPGFPY